MVVVICSLVMPALRDLNFCTRSFVVIGLRIRYRRTASSVIPSLLVLQLFINNVKFCIMQITQMNMYGVLRTHITTQHDLFNHKSGCKERVQTSAKAGH